MEAWIWDGELNSSWQSVCQRARAESMRIRTHKARGRLPPNPASRIAVEALVRPLIYNHGVLWRTPSRETILSWKAV